MIPLSLMQGNVVFDLDGNPFAIYIIESVPYAFQPKSIKIGIIDEITKALTGLSGDVYLYLLAKQYSSEQIADQMGSYSDTPGWRKQIDYTQKHIEKKLPYHRINYLAMPLKKRLPIYFDQDKMKYLKEVGTNALQGVRDTFGKLQGFVLKRDMEYTHVFLEHMQQQSDDIHRMLEGSLKRIRKATMRECEWWLKKGYHRGLADPELLLPEKFPTQIKTEEDEVQRILPVRASLHTVTKLSKDHLDYIETHTDDGISYSSYLPILSVPPEIDESDPTGYEWIYNVVERLDFPVDTAFKLTIETHDEARSKIKRRRKVVKGQIQEWKAGKQEVPEEVMEDLDGINDVLRKFRQQKLPLIHMTGVFAVGSASLQTLRSQKKRLISVAEEMDVVVSNSPGDQLHMFQHFYPFAKKQLPRTWQIPMEPGTIGASVPLGVRKLGDPCGFHFARLVGTNRPVFMDPKRPAMKLNRASTILIVGVPGSGKTATAKYIIYIMAEWGAYIYAEDPKGDFMRFYEHPTIRGNGRMVMFTSESKTTFTPFRLSDNEGDRKAAAATICELMFNPQGSGVNEIRGFVIDMAMERMYQGEKWDMAHFEKELMWVEKNHSQPEYQYQANLALGHLRKQKTKGVGALLYGEDNGESIFDRRILIAITRGLSIPDRKKSVDKWSDEERASAALKYASTKLGLEKLMSLPAHVPKVIDLEEYWILKAFPGGQQLVETAIRFSRFVNMTVILSTQNPTDPAEDEANDGGDDVIGMFSWKIILRLDSEDQVAAALKLMGMTEHKAKDWIQTFSVDYKNGKGLAKDPEGNIGEIQVQPLDPDLMYYFESTPEEELEKLEEVIANG